MPRARARLSRFRRALPLLFLLYALLALVGGALYTPNNYDALTYRLPRVLHWLADGQWHWIDSNVTRMNMSATGFEWLMAPLVALTGSDRLLFLINVTAYLLLPGLLFGMFIRLGMRKRVAWYWMWLLPSGYCLALQAGGIGNDLLGAAFFLASLDFVLRARETGDFRDFALGLLAAALCTGVKGSNLPLMLPWMLAAWPCWRLVLARPVATGFVAVAALAVSFLPTAVTNTHYSGDWAGDPKNVLKLKVINPVNGVLGNSLILVTENLAPPVAPFAGDWNRLVLRQVKSGCLRELSDAYPVLTLTWPELAQEETAGLGLGLFALLAVSVAFAWRMRARGSPSKTDSQYPCRVLVCAGAWIALLAYMSKMGGAAAPRLVMPYYALLVASVLLLPGHALLVRNRWWRTIAFMAALSALPPVVLSTSRPLWPAQTVCRKLHEAYPQSALFKRAAQAYEVYNARADALAPLKVFIPDGVKTLGFAGSLDDAETSLWRPFGTRRLVDLTPENLKLSLGKQVRYLVVSGRGIRETCGMSLDDWLTENRLRVVGKKTLVTKLTDGEQEWAVAEAGEQ